MVGTDRGWLRRGLALMLFALDSVYRDTAFHTPHVDRW
jgi:hypothetical protein